MNNQTILMKIVNVNDVKYIKNENNKISITLKNDFKIIIDNNKLWKEFRERLIVERETVEIKNVHKLDRIKLKIKKLNDSVKYLFINKETDEVFNIEFKKGSETYNNLKKKKIVKKTFTDLPCELLENIVQYIDCSYDYKVLGYCNCCETKQEAKCLTHWCPVNCSVDRYQGCKHVYIYRSSKDTLKYKKESLIYKIRFQYKNINRMCNRINKNKKSMKYAKNRYYEGKLTKIVFNYGKATPIEYLIAQNKKLEKKINERKVLIKNEFDKYRMFYILSEIPKHGINI